MNLWQFFIHNCNCFEIDLLLAFWTLDRFKYHLCITIVLFAIVQFIS